LAAAHDWPKTHGVAGASDASISSEVRIALSSATSPVPTLVAIM
jgi:hypothetical protein